MSRCVSMSAVRVLFGLLWLAGCASGDASSDATAMRDSAGVAIAENDLLRPTASCAVGAAPTVSIGTDDGAEMYQLYRVFGASKLSDGRIVLVNQGSQSIRFYDAKGTFLTQSGRAGQGPGEFSNAFYLWVLPGDSIWVGDYGPWQFHVFGPDGTWKRTVRPTPQYTNSPEVLSVLDNGRSVLAARGLEERSLTGFTLQHLTPVMHAPDGALIDTIGTYPNGLLGNMGEDPSGPWMQPHFESFARVAARGSRIVVGHGATPELSVYEAADSLHLERIIRWTTVDRAVTPAAVDAERKRLREQYPDLDPAMFRRMVQPLIREDRPAAEKFPAFAGIVVGRDGRIWVREYPMPDQPQTRSYIGFDREGRFVCRAVMPPFDNLYEFGKDYLLALHRDSLRVEHVVEYSLAGPAAPKTP
jgi:hypothetical protein